MKAQWTRSDGSYGVMDFPLIGVQQEAGMFMLTGYADSHDAHMETPKAGIADCLQFEIFDDDQPGTTFE